MSTRDPAPLLVEATKAFENQKLIAILGLPKSGKSVIAALIHNAIVNKFLPSKPNYRLRINSGVDFLKKTTLSLKKGEFPIKTPESEINQVEMVLSQEVSTGGPTELKLHDIAGEVYEKLFSQELPRNELLYRTLTLDKGKAETFGSFSFVIFCRMYAFLVDCEQFSNWDAVSYDNVKVLNAILQWKMAIGKAVDNKINVPMAIILTKTDLLPEQERLTDVENLLKSRMPDFYQQLKSVAGGKVEFFKFYVDVERGTDNKPIIIDVASQENVAQSTIQEVPASQQSQGESIPQPNPNPQTSSSLSPASPTITHRFKVKIPLSYSEDEYVRFISWIDENIK